MPVKSIVIPLETEYLQAEAKARGVSRTMLARLVMEKVIADRLVAQIVGEAPLTVPRRPRYRRFRTRDSQ